MGAFELVWVGNRLTGEELHPSRLAPHEHHETPGGEFRLELRAQLLAHVVNLVPGAKHHRHELQRRYRRIDLRESDDAEHGAVQLANAHAAHGVRFRALKTVRIDDGACPGPLTVPIGLTDFLQNPVIQRAVGGNGGDLDDFGCLQAADAEQRQTDQRACLARDRRDEVLHHGRHSRKNVSVCASSQRARRCMT